MYKKSIFAIAAAMLIFSAAGNAGAQTVQQKPSLQLSIDGQTVDPEFIYASPKGTSMAPSRWLANFIQADLTWNPAEQTVQIVKGEHTIVFVLGQSYAVVNGQQVTLGDAPIVYRNTTYIPIKETLQLFQYDINWIQDTKTIEINSPGEPAEQQKPQSDDGALEAVQRFVEYTNNEDLEGTLSVIDPSSELYTALKTAVGELYEDLDLVTELQDAAVLQGGAQSATVYTKELTENKNGKFHMDSLQEIVYSLVLNDQGQWKIAGVQIQSVEYTNIDQLLSNEAEAPAADKEQIVAVYEQNEKASNEEDLEAYLSTIHPDSVGGISNETMKFVFQQYDLEYETVELKLIGFEDERAYLYTVSETKKISGPEFADNKTAAVHELKKTDEGAWKLYNTYIISMEPLQE